MTTRFAIVCGTTFCLSISACSSSSSNGEGATGGTIAATGGTASTTGGTTSTATGGQSTSTGGQPFATGGQSSTATGGQVSATGGQPAATGGQASTTTGGRVSTSTGGRATAAGGKSSGGATGSGGGATATGGATGTGGAAGGSTPAGGTSSGCGMAAPATGVQSKDITVGTEARTYKLFIPTGYSASTPMPLLFAWHGLGGSGTLARQYFRIEQAAANKAVIVYPDALPLANQGNQTGWNLSATGNDFAFFDAMLKEVSASLCIDTNRVFSAGHSFGAMMTNALGCYRGDVLRAIAPVAGMPPGRGNTTCTGEVAAWIAHGDNDPTVDFTTGGIASRDFWLTKNGCTMTSAATTPAPCVAYEGCRDGLPVHWCVHQDQHNWPSFAGAGLWAFFASFN
jgi:polyhydroxybutyrate depolymerase